MKNLYRRLYIWYYADVVPYVSTEPNSKWRTGFYLRLGNNLSHLKAGDRLGINGMGYGEIEYAVVVKRLKYGIVFFKGLC